MNKKKVENKRKFMGGVSTPDKLYKEVALGNNKCPCGLDAAMRALTFAPLQELLQKEPERLQWMAQQNNGQLPIVELTYGKFIKLGSVYACELCRPALEKTLARLPSWVLVELQTGPGPDKPSVSVLETP